MVRELAPIEPIDLDDAPDLLRLAQEVRASGRPRLLRHNGKDVAILAPPPAPRSPEPDEAAIPAGSVAARTAGAIQWDGPTLTIRELREVFERGVAEQVIESMKD